MGTSLRPRLFFSGWSSLYQEDGSVVKGYRYRLTRSDHPWKDPQYIFDEGSATWWTMGYGERQTEPVADPATIQTLDVLREDDRRIVEEWLSYARTRANGDTALAEVIFIHLQYQNGALVEPAVYEGVDFWDVGQNASHSFAAGCKDGKRFVRSFTYDEERDEDVSHITQIPDGQGWGYLGHF